MNFIIVNSDFLCAGRMLSVQDNFLKLIIWMDVFVALLISEQVQGIKEAVMRNFVCHKFIKTLKLKKEGVKNGHCLM